TLQALPQLDPDALPPGFDNVAAQCIHDSILRGKSGVSGVGTATGLFPGFPHPPACPPWVQEVRLLACCCLVEVLRICAPTPP
ncbi:hypothetical protein, partial [Vibrio cholerae]|uniref:hypothetical protein n=1 Tax=Vibrio cholerae TaxID=666 RepID=UPI00301C16F8